MIGMQGNPYTITNEERQKYDLQFNKLFPVNGFLGSNQAAPFFLQSNLNKLQLQQIWTLADLTQDGKLDRLEFAIAMKLIKISLNGIPLPTSLPPSMQFIGNTHSPAHSISTTSSNGSSLSRGNSLKDITTKSRSNSQEFGIQKQMRLKYIQRFNFEDRTKCGFLSSVQARHVLNESRLPKHTLAEIWKLSDLNQDGKLTQDEFVIAMHLVDQVKAGNILPSVLPANLLPSNYRNTPPMGIQPGQMMPTQMMSAQRSRQNSLDSLPTESVFSSFEDKRRENIEKGQKELEKRRQALLDQERKERELKEQKEREERERLEKIRLEQERKREEEMQRRMEQQLKEEQEREEARRKEQERKIQAQREMERQRMLEMQRMKRKELTQQKLKLQEEVSRLRAKSQTVDMEKLNIDAQKEKLFEKCKELEERMTNTQVSLTNITELHQKSHMLATKSQNDLEFYKGSLDTVIMTKQQFSGQITSTAVNVGNVSVLEEELKMQRISCEGLKTELEKQKQSHLARQKELNSLQSHLNELNSQFMVKQNEKEQLHNEINSKNNQLIDLKKQKENLIRRRNSIERKEKLEQERQLQKELEAKQKVEETRNMVESMQLGAVVKNDKTKEDIRKKIAEMQNERSKKQKQTGQTAMQPSKTFKLSQDASTLPTYQALFSFTASRPDELSLKEGDIVHVDESQDAEHEWLLGSKNGKAGWFPFNYVQKLSQQNVTPKPTVAVEDNISKFPDTLSNENKLSNEKNISNLLKSGNKSAFVPTPIVAANQPQQMSTTAVKSSDEQQSTQSLIKVRAKFPFDAPKETHLKFNKDDIIIVTEKQDKWWKGRCHEKSGWFPKSYVKPIETSTPTLGIKNKSSPKTSPLVKRKAPQPPVAAARKKSQKARPKVPSNEYVAAFDFVGEQDGDLPFVTGDVIVVTSQDGDWWTGKLGSKEGIFPGNYVTKKQDTAQTVQVKHVQETAQQPTSANENSENSPNPSSSAEKPDIAVVIADYKATSAEQLSLTKGGYVQVRKKSEKGWWEGVSLMARGKKQSGWFPADYVKLKDAQSTGKTEQAVNKAAEKLVYAMYDYQAINTDELTFKMDDVIVVVEDVDADWWKGYLKSDHSKSQGHFPRNYVRTNNQSKLDENYLNRVMELINSEESYLKDLELADRDFQQPLKDTNLVTEEEISTLFVNLNQLVVCSTKLIREFKLQISRESDQLMIGDILCRIFPTIKQPYTEFCSCQLRASSFLIQKLDSSPEFKAFVKLHESGDHWKGLPVSSWLVKPMQRITKYPLLVKKILENTPEGFEDRGKLQKALELSEEVCRMVNEGVRSKENEDRLMWMEKHVNMDHLHNVLKMNSETNCLGNRQYLHCGLLNKVKSNKDLAVFLFNDLLLLTTPNKPLSCAINDHIFTMKNPPNFKMYKEPIMLNEVMVKSAGDFDENCFQLTHIDSNFLFKCDSNEKAGWINKFKKATENYRQTESKNNTARFQARNNKNLGVGRLIVTIVQASISNATNSNPPYCEATMGQQCHTTKPAQDVSEPKWNHSMQFYVKDIQIDEFKIFLYQKDLYSPNEFLGSASVRICDLKNENHKGQITKKLPLKQASHVTLKLHLLLFNND